MAEYIGKYENAAAIQSAVDGGELVKPYVALDENTGMIDWNTKFIDYANMPLTFEILSDGNLYWRANNTGFTKTLEYCKNGGEWTEITSTTGGTTISVISGDIVQFRGNNTYYATNSSRFNSFGYSTAQFKVKGNIMSLINSTNFSTLSAFTSSSATYRIFINCSTLTDASNLILPATTLTSNCYGEMFRNCTSLTTAPTLPATTLASSCYTDMFSGCRSLNYIKCLATDISATNCTYNWVNGVASTGTFVKAAGVNWERNNNGIPSGWTVIEE